MSFFDRVKETANSAVQSTGEMLEVAKLNLDVRSAEDKINTLFAKMGKLVFASYENGKVKEADMVALCETVKTSYVNVEELRRKILELRNKKACVKCKAELNENDPFCNKCGKKQPEVDAETEETSEAPKAEAEGKSE